MANLDEELLARQEEFEARQQQERMQREQEQQSQNSIRAQVANQVKQKVKQEVKKRAKQAAVRVVIATSPYWGTALLIILGLILILFTVIAVPAYACNSKVTDGIDVAALKVLVALVPGDVCASFTGDGGRSGGGGASGDWNTAGLLVPIPTQYYNASNFGPAKADYPKVTPEALSKIETIFATASAQGLTGFKITSALRDPSRFHYSCHLLGEGVDFVFIPGVAKTDPKIQQLIGIIRQVGVGYVQDEYNNPSSNATGDHIHIGMTTDPNCLGRQSEVDYYVQSGEYSMP